MTEVSTKMAGGELSARVVTPSDPRIWTPPAGWSRNSLLYGWGYITAICVSRRFREPDLTLGTLYIEFENVASPGATVAAPTVDRDEGVTYYNGLASSSSKDYLRVPVIAEPTLDVQPGYEGRFAAGQGNRLTFYGVTASDVGVHGKPFSAAANSVVYGGALVASPNFADPTQDIVWARGYLNSAQQVAKPGSAIGLYYRTYFQ